MSSKKCGSRNAAFPRFSPHSDKTPFSAEKWFPLHSARVRSLHGKDIIQIAPPIRQEGAVGLRGDFAKGLVECGQVFFAQELVGRFQGVEADTATDTSVFQ